MLGVFWSVSTPVIRGHIQLHILEGTIHTVYPVEQKHSLSNGTERRNEQMNELHNGGDLLGFDHVLDIITVL